LTADDAWRVKNIMEGYDELDEYSRRKPEVSFPADGAHIRIGIPKQAQFYGWDTEEARALYHEAIEIVSSQMNATIVEIDFRPFTETARSLYEGPFISERLSTLKDFYTSNPDACHPVTASILERGKMYSATDTFTAIHRLEKLKKEAYKIWRTEGLDALLVPTTSVTPTIQYALNFFILLTFDSSIEKVPIAYNTVLGYYTNFVNLLDMCAMAVPNGFLPSGVPNGVTFISTAWNDEFTYKLGKKFQQIRNLSLGATGFQLPKE
jgi:allophanate hydrolase